jgi:hypothetical protein
VAAATVVEAYLSAAIVGYANIGKGNGKNEVATMVAGLHAGYYYRCCWHAFSFVHDERLRFVR